MWTQILLIAIIHLFHVSSRSFGEDIEDKLWFDRINNIIRQSKIEEVTDIESDDSPYYRNSEESDIRINERSTLSSLKTSSDKRALSMFARWGPINTIGKDRNPIRSGYSPSALDAISTQTRGRMMGQPLRWG